MALKGGQIAKNNDDRSAAVCRASIVEWGDALKDSNYKDRLTL